MINTITIHFQPYIQWTAHSVLMFPTQMWQMCDAVVSQSVRTAFSLKFRAMLHKILSSEALKQWQWTFLAVSQWCTAVILEQEGWLLIYQSRKHLLASAKVFTWRLCMFLTHLTQSVFLTLFVSWAVLLTPWGSFVLWLIVAHLSTQTGTSGAL